MIHRATYFLIALNLAMFAVVQASGDLLPAYLTLRPFGHGFAPWQIPGAALLHAGIGHLLVNMLGLWLFGRDVERDIGAARLLLLYAGSVLIADSVYLVGCYFTGRVEPAIGASAGVLGVLTTYVLFYPHRKVIEMLLPVPLPAVLIAALYALFEAYAGVGEHAPGVVRLAQLCGGALGGLFFGLMWKDRAPQTEF